MKHKSGRFLFILFLVVLTAGILPLLARAADSIPIDTNNFPDATFRSYISSTFDKDGDGSLSEDEVTAATVIQVTGKGISSLQGVQYFTSLKELHCSENNLQELDISKNPDLFYLNCGMNKISSLDLGLLPKLTQLGVYKTNISSLDLSKNEKLKNTYLYGKVDSLPMFDSYIYNECVLAISKGQTMITAPCLVTFVDGQGNTLKVETVQSGTAATAPSDPTRAGYDFAGWDKDFSNVTSDMTVTALWTKKDVPSISDGTNLLATLKSRGIRNLTISWTRVIGAEGYDIFFGKCKTAGKSGTFKKVKTIKGNKIFKWTKKKLKKKTAYKAVVRAYVTKDGQKTYIGTSPLVYACTSGGTYKYTNPKNVFIKDRRVSLSKGQTSVIKARVTKLQKRKKLLSKGNTPKLRYISTNEAVATVSRSGRITAVAEGSCRIYVMTINGLHKAVYVTVK